MKELVLQRVKEYIAENKLSKSAFASSINMEQTTVNNQLIGKRGLSIDLILSFLNSYPEISAEWLLRGKGEMYLQSGDVKTEDLQFLREKIIRLEAENKVLREVVGLHSGNDEVTNEKTA